MRWTAPVKDQNSAFARVMVAEEGSGALLFLFRSKVDEPCQADMFFDTVQEAKSECFDTFKVREVDWQKLPDQILGCQKDWIAPVRSRRKEGNRAAISCFEQLIGNAWIPIE